MAQKRKPRSTPQSGEFDFTDEPDSTAASSSAPAGQPSDEFDIDLEDYAEKPQHRPRLPEQRREAPLSEMSGSSTTPRDFAAPQPAESFQAGATAPVWQPVSEEEISSFDPNAAVTPSAETPRVSKSSAPAPEPKSEDAQASASLAGMDDLDEFIAQATSRARVDTKETRVRKPFSTVEKVCVSAGGIIVIALLFWLFRAVTSVSSAGGAVSTPLPDLPIEGSLVTIKEATSGWRRTTESDRVGQMEVILPQPGFKMPAIIPQVSFTIDPSASSTGFLRFIFRDSLGKAQGDTRVVQVSSGKLTDLGKGEIIKSGEEGSVYASSGLLDMSSYHSYSGSNEPRWSVEVAESSDYSAGDKDWKVLGTFDVRNQLAP